jgi:hypothetical protein
MKALQLNKGVIVFIITLVVSAVFVACRKIDYTNSRDRYKIDRSGEFFKLTPDVNPTVRRVAEAMKRYNKQHEFVNNFVKKHGVPVWNKCPVFKPKQTTSRINDGDPELGGNDTLIFIPIIQKDDNELDRVVSFVAAVATEDTITLRLFNADEFAGYGMTDRADTLCAETIASTSMWLETIAVENRDTFALYDNSLFHSRSFNDDSLRYITIDTSDASEHGRLNTDELIYNYETFCYTTIVCYPLKAFRTTLLRPCEPEPYCVTYAWIDYVLTLPGMILPPESTGGGGSGYLDENVACSSFPQGQCGYPPYIPWGPITDDVLDMTNYAYWGYHHLETWEVSPYDQSKINNWLQNNLDTAGLDPCVKGVLNKLLTGNSSLGKLLLKLQRSVYKSPNMAAIKLRFEVDSLPPGQTAHTTPGSIAINYTFTDTIKIDRKIVNKSTELMLAICILHEIAHAYMNYMFTVWANSYDPTLFATIPSSTMFKKFADTLLTINNAAMQANPFHTQPLSTQHNFMATTILEMFVDALKEVDNSRNSDEFYWDIAWHGLLSDGPMKTVWPSYIDDPWNDWPPTNPAPSNDSTRGLKYALTLARVDSIRHYLSREQIDTAQAKGRKHLPNGCF